jgi:membrane protease YdiL (CAAX protease family)
MDGQYGAPEQLERLPQATMSGELWSALLRVLPFIVALLFIGAARRRGKIRDEMIALRAPGRFAYYAAWCVSFLLFVVAVELALARAGLLQIDPWNHPLLPSVIRIAGAVVLAPVVEEILLRGVLLTKLSEKLNLHLAIVIQAAVFVLLHAFAYDNNTVSRIAIAQTMTDGILYGYARRHTQSLFTPITMHATGNLIATLERFF